MFHDFGEQSQGWLSTNCLCRCAVKLQSPAQTAIWLVISRPGGVQSEESKNKD